MARIRTIKPELPHSENLAKCRLESRLCFILLWTLADDEGKLRGDARLLASLLYPYDDDVDGTIVEGWLDDLSTHGLITRYQIAENSYIRIDKWLIHQKIEKPSASKLPNPLEYSRTLSNDREGSEKMPRNGVEGNGVERSGENPLPATPQAKSSELSPADVAQTFLTETLLSGNRILNAARDACQARVTATGKTPQDCITEIIAEWRKHLQDTEKRFQKSPENFLAQCNKHLTAKVERKLPEPASVRILRRMAEEERLKGLTQ